MCIEDVDLFSAQILGNNMRTISNEIELTLIRAAYSSVIKESFDCSAAVLGADFRFWGQADAIPLQMGVLSQAAQSMVREYRESLGEGDVLLTNDPAMGAPHLNDFLCVAPVRIDGATLAYVATIAHFTDVGGKVPGSMPADSTDLFQEGFRLPPTLIVRGGQVDERILAILCANTRTPVNLEADLRAELAACALGVTRLRETIERHGAGRTLSAMERYLAHSERLGAGRLRALVPGVYRASRRIDNQRPDDDSPPAVVAAAVTVTDQQVIVDFSDSSPQVERPINVVPSNGYSAALCALRGILGSDVPFNGGIQRLLTTTCVEGSLMNPVTPAPVAARALVAALAFECVLDALSQAAGDEGAASSSGGTTMPYVWAPDPLPGEAASIMVDNSLTGGSGARAGRCGVDAVENAVTNAVNVPAEMLEAEFPMLVERYEIRHGSGGPGRWAGGSGMRRVVRFLRPGTLSIRGHGMQNPPVGKAGGGDGAASRFTIIREGEELNLPGLLSGFRVQAGDLFIAETPGGGGYGAPQNEKRRED
ncbi:hydantoinase B/oxoprolinase family protein [Microbacterium sp. No. 7]|uniref:hydantoinase B/oxoprolinase family protein n=1 Tax=Microbacterium sp. No. 7 TaxID=1714373 RepID=UPI0006CFD001|nr:hydantoinase B/oxoprolinase family protein [Microbacterium sp. No. 7]ALJ22102.1 hypothetical protein AOA12_20325 [Microbacterium sp. No. 7]